MLAQLIPERFWRWRWARLVTTIVVFSFFLWMALGFNEMVLQWQSLKVDFCEPTADLPQGMKRVIQVGDDLSVCGTVRESARDSRTRVLVVWEQTDGTFLEAIEVEWLDGETEAGMAEFRAIPTRFRELSPGDYRVRVSINNPTQNVLTVTVVR